MHCLLQPAVQKKKGFSCSPITKHLMHRINGISYHENNNISPTELRYLRIPHIDFNGETRIGEMICNHRIADSLIEIFYTLYEHQYPIERIQLVDDYHADDDLCCLKNNTSCFNYRNIAGTDILSRHAFGMAVDVNPFFNPYITYLHNQSEASSFVGSSWEDNHCSLAAPESSPIRISPPGSEAYADRERSFPHKLGPGDLCYELFLSHGFTWGGDWTHCKDYQHFEIQET